MKADIFVINSDIRFEVVSTALSIDRQKASKRLILILNTVGGYPDVAYRTMRHLNTIYEEIIAVVPDFAMSAGTLMSVGADKIYMKQGSSLGPLDLQVPHPTDGGQISTLDIREAAYDIFGLTATITKQLYEQNYFDLKIGKGNAAKLAHETAVSLLSPMVDKIDPYHLHASYRNAVIGQKYARILLMSRMMKDNQSQAIETSKILAENYETHSYAITFDEAVNFLKLRVEDIDGLSESNFVQLIISNMPEGINFSYGVDEPEFPNTSDSEVNDKSVPKEDAKNEKK